MNKLPVNAPNPSGWHHAQGGNPLWGKTRVSKEEEEVPVLAEEKNKALVRRFFEAQANRDLAAVTTPVETSK